jgi:hypothetical protein
MADERPYYGQFTFRGVGFCLEGSDDDTLFVSRLVSPTEVEPVCMITGKDRNQSHELVMLSDEAWPDDYRRALIFAAVNQYRLWSVDH